MLATFVIGLREGLEASLIIGIIAAFLAKNGKSLTPMWIGVGIALVLSVAVGVALDLIEQALPQAEQEGMEAIIGAIAIFFVTGMIAWMNVHARNLRGRLEADAAAALSQAGAYALASMAFLAVLREGFETSVFLLATFSAAQSAALAALGAIVGLLCAVGIGWGIYIGGVRVNLSRFFRFTGAFLILVAAGLAVTSLRTAHEAGWLNAGQQATVDLSWLVAPGTVRSALITGVLGIPGDPRLIEVIGWFAYLVPVALFVYWPRSRRPEPRRAAMLQLMVAGGLAACAIALAVLYPTPAPRLPPDAPIIATMDDFPIGTARLARTPGDELTVLNVLLSNGGDSVLALPRAGMGREEHDGIESSVWNLESKSAPQGAAGTLSLDDVIGLSGGRIPVGLNARQHPGPFSAAWLVDRTTTVWAAGDTLLDAVQHSVTLVALSGSGLQTPRTITVDHDAGSTAPADWAISPDYRDRVAGELARMASLRRERLFWAEQLPIGLIVIALIAAALAGSRLIRLRRVRAAHSFSQANAKADAKGAHHAAL